jgi:hypothetical protein
VTTSGHIFNEDVKVVLDAEKNGLDSPGWDGSNFEYDDDSGGIINHFFHRL